MKYSEKFGDGKLSDISYNAMKLNGLIIFDRLSFRVSFLITYMITCGHLCAFDPIYFLGMFNFLRINEL